MINTIKTINHTTLKPHNYYSFITATVDSTKVGVTQTSVSAVQLNLLSVLTLNFKQLLYMLMLIQLFCYHITWSGYNYIHTCHH